MTRAGVGLALIVASVAALLFLDLALKAADQLRGHGADLLSAHSAPSDLKSNHSVWSNTL